MPSDPITFHEFFSLRHDLSPNEIEPGWPAPGPDCPLLDVLMQSLMGNLAPDETSRIAAHAAQCAYCGTMVRAYEIATADTPVESDPTAPQHAGP